MFACLLFDCFVLAGVFCLGWWLLFKLWPLHLCLVGIVGLILCAFATRYG